MRAVLPSFVEKILFSFLSGNNRSQMVRLPREIVIFTGNDSDLYNPQNEMLSRL